MSEAQLLLIPAFILMGTSLSLLAAPSWRGTMLALALQYVGVFWLVFTVWPVGLALVKLLVGLVAGAILATSQASTALGKEQTALLGSRIFRVLAALLIWIVVISISPLVADWLKLKQEFVLGGVILIAMGLLQMGITIEPVRLIIGLLTFLSGFEILYAALEVSVLVAGLLAAVNLALAMVGAFLAPAASSGGSA